jgi:hypothetical protein
MDDTAAWMHGSAMLFLLLKRVDQARADVDDNKCS